MFGLAGAGLITMANQPTCDPASTSPPVRWASDLPQQVEEAMLSVKKPYAEDTARLSNDRLDAFVGEWTQAYNSTCRADDERRQRAEACLANSTTSFNAVIDRLTEGDELGVVNAGSILEQLASPSPCAGADPPSADASVTGEQFQTFVEAKVDAAAGSYERALEELEELSNELPKTADDLHAQTLTLLGQMQAKRGRLDEARYHLGLASGRTYTPEPQVQAKLALTDLLLELEDYDAAKDQLNGAQHSISDTSFDTQADFFDLDGKYEMFARYDAEAGAQRHEKALELRQRREVPDQSQLFATRQLLAHALAAKEEFDKATKLYEAVREYRKGTVGEAHPLYGEALFNLGVHEADDRGRFNNARKYLEDALEIVRNAEGESSHFTARIKAKLAESLLELGEKEEALKLANESWRTQQSLPQTHSDYRASLAALASVEQGNELWEASLEHHLLLNAAQELAGSVDPSALHNLAYLSCKADRCPEARKWIEATRAELAKLSPEQREELGLLVQMMLLYSQSIEMVVEIDAGNRERAIELAREIRETAEALEIEPGDTRSQGQLKTLYEEFEPYEERLGLRPTPPPPDTARP